MVFYIKAVTDAYDLKRLAFNFNRLHGTVWTDDSAMPRRFNKAPGTCAVGRGHEVSFPGKWVSTSQFFALILSRS